MKKISFLSYGILCYMAFLSTILYAIGFVGNLGPGRSIDGEAQASFGSAVLIDASLLLLFAFQHSIMARPAFKSWWTRVIPAPIERSTFVLLSSACLVFMMWQWQPVGGIVWSVEHNVMKTVIFILYLGGWGIVFISTFLINHFDLFGLRQVWFYYLGKNYSPLSFRVPGLYRLVRHPLYLGFMIAFWCTPVMTVAHLLFAIITTIYILTAIQFEERDLLIHFGEKYRQYKRWAPMLIPFTKRKQAKESEP